MAAITSGWPTIRRECSLITGGAHCLNGFSNAEVIRRLTSLTGSQGLDSGLTKVKGVHAHGSNALLLPPNQRCPAPAYRRAAG